MILNLVLGLGTSKNVREATRKAKQLLEKESNGTAKRSGKYYRTSTAVLALFGDSRSPMARKFLQRTGSLYTKIPGAVDPFLSKLDKVTDWDDPMDYLKSIAKDEKRKKLDDEKRRISDAEISKSQIKEITNYIVSQSSPKSPQHRTMMNSSSEMFLDRTGNNHSSEKSRTTASRPVSQEKQEKTTAHEGHHATKKPPIDFLHLFQNQPDSDFYPMGRESYYKEKHQEIQHQIHRSRSNSPFSPSYLDSPHRNSASNIFSNNSPKKSSNNNTNSSALLPPHNHKKVVENKHHNNAAHRSFSLTAENSLKNSIRTLSPLEKAVQEKIHVSQQTFNDNANPHLHHRFYHRKPQKNIQQTRPSLYFQHLTKDSNNVTNHSNSFQRLQHISTGSAIGYLNNEESLTLVSSTIESESQEASLAQNDYAEVPISLNAKAALMNLLVTKTTKIYKNQIATNQTAQRIALLQGQDISFTSVPAPKKRTVKK
jgi:hypothetical protein